jgi:hypothetical protein
LLPPVDDPWLHTRSEQPEGERETGGSGADDQHVGRRFGAGVRRGAAHVASASPVAPGRRHLARCIVIVMASRWPPVIVIIKII